VKSGACIGFWKPTCVVVLRPNSQVEWGSSWRIGRPICRSKAARLNKLSSFAKNSSSRPVGIGMHIVPMQAPSGVSSQSVELCRVSMGSHRLSPSDIATVVSDTLLSYTIVVVAIFLSHSECQRLSCLSKNVNVRFQAISAPASL